MDSEESSAKKAKKKTDSSFTQGFSLDQLVKENPFCVVYALTLNKDGLLRPVDRYMVIHSPWNGVNRAFMIDELQSANFQETVFLNEK